MSAPFSTVRSALVSLLVLATGAAALVAPSGASALGTTATTTATTAAAAAPTPVSAQIDFMPAGATPLTGWTADTGAPYSAAAGRGWVREDSLGATDGPTPVDLSVNTRNRTSNCATGTINSRTFIHLQAPTDSATSTTIKGAWEYAVPDGQYRVELGYGDANPGADPESHTLNVEGVPLVRNDPGALHATCNGATRVRKATGWVQVSDGRLTVDARGGTNTKLAWVSITSVPVSGLQATATASGVDLAWDAVDGAAGYRVWRTESLPVPGGGQAPATLLGSPTGASWTDATGEAGVVYSYSVGLAGTADAGAGAVTTAAVDAAAPTVRALPLRIDFKDRAGAGAAGYVGDFGQGYSNTRGYGWVDPTTTRPLSLVGNGRTRTGTGAAGLTTQRASTIHAQYQATGFGQANGVQRRGDWQLAVPDGRYDVQVSVGDPDPGTDPTRHVVRVEGRPTVDHQAVTNGGAPSTGDARFATGTARDVPVTDGFLTLDTLGGTNTKITDLVVSRSVTPPTGLTATAEAGRVTLDWADNPETDLVGYRVFRSSSLPVVTTGTPLATTTASSHVDTTVTDGTTYHYAVVAVGAGDVASGASEPVTARPDAAETSRPELPVKVNFVDAATAVGAGFTKDFGQAFANTRGYGWVVPGGSVPLDLVGNGRLRPERTAPVDIRQRGLLHMQGGDVPNFTGVAREGAWELAVDDGTYDVTVSVGDQPGAGTAACPAPCYDSSHTLRVEGQPAVTAFRASAADEFETAVVRVTVSDGRLTLDASGGTNTKVNYIDVERADTAAPAVVEGLSATAGENEVGLAWEAGDEPDLVGYHVYSALTEQVATVPANRLTTAPQAATTFRHTPLANGTRRHYVVTAVDRAGNESPASAVVDATPQDTTAPQLPPAVRATAGDGSVTLDWEPSASSDVQSYRVYRSTSEPVQASGTPVATVDAPATEHVDTTVENGTRYFYAVVAVDAAGNASVASASGAVTPADTTAPPVPQHPNAAPGDGKVTLTWSAGQASDAVTWRVYRSTSPGAGEGEDEEPVALVATDRGTEYVDTEVDNGTTYYYRVRAVDLAGNASELSAEVSATPVPDPDTTAPAVPSGVRATGADSAVDLTWDAVGDADLRGYRVYRSATAGAPGTLVSGDAPVTATGFRDTGVVNDTAYHYTVTAVDTTGNESDPSGEVSATPTDTTPPGPPTGVTAVGSANSVILTWDAAPAGSDVTRHRVYRTRGQGTFPTGFEQFGSFTADQPPRFVDANVTVGTTYRYVVTAVDAAFNESVGSAVASATPTEAPDTTPPAPPSGLSAAVEDDDVTLTWTASPSDDTAGYEVYRATAPGGQGTKISTTLTETRFVDADRPRGSTGYYWVVALDRAANSSTPSGTVTATVAPTGVDVGYVFQPDIAPVPSGFTKDTGAAWSAAAGRGWVTQASLAGASHTPLNLSANTRLRTRTGVTDLQNRLLHMQYGDIVPTPTGNGDLTAGAWELALEPGRYEVSASVGDQPGGAKTGCAAPCYDSLHVLRAEGTSVVAAFQPTATTEYRTGTTTVDVTDGRLTLDAIGGNNTKINWVRVRSAGPVAPDTTPPGAVGGLVATPADGAATLSWSAPADPDVAAYRVYRAVGEVVEPGEGTQVGVVSGSTSFTDTGLSNGLRYAYAVRALDNAGNVGPVSPTVTVVPAAGASEVSLKVDFGDATTAPAPGYLADHGQAFGARSGANQGTGLSYGWVTPESSTPVSLVGNGRNRNVASGTTPAAGEPDARRATFLHMQYVGTAAGSVSAPGSWEVAVPNGLYTVTVDVGDAGAPVDSSHWVNVENQNALAAFTPSGAQKYATATRTVAVSDGRLTLSPVGGTNTKITYVDIASVARAGRPYSTVVLPANGSGDVVTNVSPTASNDLPGGAVDPQRVTTGVRLTRVSDGAVVPGTGGTSGGGDTVSFRPSVALLPNTLYRFDVLDSATDVAGNRFVPFSSVFTTRTDSTNPGTIGAAFDRTESGALKGKAYTSMAFGPDGRLYASTIFGHIYRYDVAADGTLTNPFEITTVRTHATAAGWEGAPNRTVIGMAFDPASTPTNPILWITDNVAYLGADVANGTGAVARLTGADLQNYQEVVINLPRSIKDHETNSLAFHDGKLYFPQGSMNAMGATDGTWKRPENLLSAAVLELDPAKLPASLPVDVSTPDLEKAPTSTRPHARSYDPYAPGAPLTLYATGVRNAYDLVWHSNGNLYVGTNGSAAGGNVPAVPSTLPASCANRPDGGYTGPSAPAVNNNRQDETDYMFNVKRGKYYGHPNPLRCEWILNAGNPTGYTGNPLFKVNAYPAGQQADPNYDLGNVYDAGMHASANGTLEYQNAGAFGGALKGKLVTARYSANQELVTFDVRGDGSLSTATTGITGFTGFAQPLDVVEDPTTGNLYVAELPNNFANTAIKLLRPRGGTTTVGRAETSQRLVFTDVAGGSATASQDVVVRNVGNGPLTITGATLGGTDAARFTATASYPIVVAAGSSARIPVTFAATVPGPRGATLTLTTDSPSTPSVTTTLRGLGTVGTGGSNEPSLQWILDTLQIPVDAGDPDPTNNAMPDVDALIGDEVEVQAFRRDPFDNIVKFEPLALFGPNGPNGDVVTVRAHDATDPDDAAGRVVVGVGPNNQNQRVLPTFTRTAESTGTPIAGLPDTFGLDFTWHGLGDRVTSTQRARNTWSSNPHKVRVYPLKNADGTVEPYAYVVAPEDVPTGVDFQDAVMIVRNVQPLVTSGNGEATPSRDELVYTAVKGTRSAEQSVRITNTGTTPLQITGVGVTGTHASDFVLAGATPETLPVGGTTTYQVAFAPGASTVGVRSAALRVTSDAAGSPLDVGLHGLALNGLEGGNEPPLADVVRTLGRAIDVGWTGLTNNSPATGPQMEGEEVPAQLFAKAGTEPVRITPVARFSPDEALPFGWYLPTGGAPDRTEVARIGTGQHQTLNPAIAAGGADSFDPGNASFGLYVDSRTFNRFSYTQDALNTGVPHAVRTYPAKDRAGNAIPHTYLVTFEDATNGDYQDYVFEVSGVRIAGESAGTTPVARIDFGPSTSPVASGYTRDSGAAYSALTGTGWVNQDTGAPQSMAVNTRVRNATNEGSLILMQPTAAQSADGPGRWRYALPNGTYTVRVGVGDPDFFDSVHRITAETVEVVPSFTATTGTRSTTGTATVTVTDGVLDVGAAGGTNTKIQYIDIDQPIAGGDTSPPQVTAQVTGALRSPGVYKGAATVTVSASDAQSSIAERWLSVDGGPFLRHTEPVRVAGLGTHTVRARAQNGAGLTTTTAEQQFRVVADSPSRGEIEVSNLDGVPFDDRLVMNRIQTPSTTSPNGVHDVSTLRIANHGSEGLNVSGLDVSGPFALASDIALPAYLAPGEVLDVGVRFTASTIGTDGGLWNGTLTVRSDDVDEPALPVELAGFWQSVSEGNQEPNLTEITRLFGFGTQITTPGVSINQQGLVKPNGDEVISPYWTRADSTRPVTVRQLGAFHTQGNTATFFWHAKSSSSTSAVLTHAGEDGQSVLPRKNDAGRTPGLGSFSPSGAFGLKIDPEWSDPTRNNSQIDRDNGCDAAAQCGHHLRAWPARDRSGAVIAHTYLVAMDYAGINYDYQDNVYLVTNLRPETAADPSAPGPVPGASRLRLEFDAPVAGTLADAAGSGTGFASTQPNKRDVSVGSDSYRADLLQLVTASGGSLRVASSGTATEGTNGSADNTLVNGLRVPFDGTGEPFSVTTRIAGPVTAYDAGSEQAGVMLGNDQDNYVKAVVISKTVGGQTGPAIEFYAESNGTGTTVGTPVLVPGAANLQSLDVALLADPGERTVRAAYRTDGGAWTVLPAAYAVPPTLAGRIFGTRSQAGLLVSHKGGAPLTAQFESFAVVDGHVAGPAPATREALLRIDTGSAASYTDTAGRVWSPDTGRFTPASAPAEGTRTDAIAGTPDAPLYATYRGNTGSVTPRTLSYALPTGAATTVDLRLHFAERASGNAAAGRRLFDIDVEGRTVRRDFDIFSAAGGLNTATVLGIDDVAVQGGALDLALRASADYPAISAIEVLCDGACPVDTTAPPVVTGLEATAAQAGVTLEWDGSPAADLAGYRVQRAASADGPFTTLGSALLTTSRYVDVTAPANTPAYYRVVAVDTSQNASEPSAVVSATRPVPVQQPVRINTGGPTQTVGGTVWTGCTSTAACNGWVSGGGFAYSEADTISGLPAGTNNTLYQSEWTGGASGGTPVAVGQRAFGFAVPVQNGDYTVRLHFAELNKTAAGARTFDVALEGTTVLSSFDVWQQAGGIDRAIVRQFPARVNDGTMTIDFVRRIENAKISAIEILPGADTTAPGAPGSLTATGGASGVSLAWAAVTGDDVAGYQVLRSATEDGEYTRISAATVTGTTYVDTSAPAGQRSYYRVRTVDTAGNTSSPASASAVRPVPVPAQVSGVSATGSASGVALSWSATSGATGYRVWRASAVNGTYELLTSSPVSGTSFADAGAPAGATSYYQVAAVNASGEGQRSSTVSATRPAAPTAQAIRINAGGPTVTTGGTTWQGCSSLTACQGRVSGGFAYGENDTTQGVPAGMNQAIFRTEWTGGQNGAGSVPVGQRAFGFAVPVTNGRYTVRLHFSELNRTAANQRLFDVRLENSTVLSSFDIWREAGGINRAIVREFQTNVSDGQVTIDFIRRLQNAKVTAIEIIPGGTVDTTAPAAVTQPSAIGTTQSVTVGWAASQASDLGGYHVYRSSSPSGPFTRVTTSALTQTTWTDTTAPAGAFSHYQVTAVDVAGNESARSTTASAARPLTSRPTVRINAGGPAVTTGGITWQGCAATGSCSGRVSGGFAHSENDTHAGVPVGLSNALFASEWTGGQFGTGAVGVGQRAFRFAVPVTNGRYAVRLHFSELNKTAAGQRTFDVQLEGSTVLSGFDVWQQAGGINKPLARDFTTTVSDGSMTIDFVRRIENAKVSAIEIIPIT